MSCFFLGTHTMHTVWIIKVHASNLTAVFDAASLSQKKYIDHFIPACIVHWDRIGIECVLKV